MVSVEVLISPPVAVATQRPFAYAAEVICLKAPKFDVCVVQVIPD